MRRVLGSSSFTWPVLTLLLVACAGACGGSKTTLKGGSEPGGDGGGGSKGQGDDGGGSSDSTPHALGLILLGESHQPSGGTSTPMVLASFVPDASKVAKTCGSQVGGCTFVSAPKCGGTSGTCGEDEECTWDSACNATCVAACTLECGTGQECYFASPNQPACRLTQSFDAGALAFAGTTTPITLFPPYQFDSTANGAPFLAGAALEVQASGATGAGFDKFEQKFSATTFLQTSPPLDKISSTAVFGSGTIPVGWGAGNDTITITVSGLGGSATCTASDASGSFQIPRAVATAAMGTVEEGGEASLSITVTREHDDWFKSETTHGSLDAATVQPVGWLEVSTASVESASFVGVPSTTGCTTGETSCPDGCFDLADDEFHCGSCTTVCASNQTCSNGQCTTGTTTETCDQCEATANTGTCASLLATCNDDGQCNSFQTCYDACTAGDTTCETNCETEYPTGLADFNDWAECICDTACVGPCASECAPQ